MNADGSPTKATERAMRHVEDLQMTDEQKVELLVRLGRAGFNVEKPTMDALIAILGAKIAADILGRDR